MNIVWIIFALFILLFLGLLIVFGSMTIDWVFDTAMPEISGLGQVGDVNVTDVSNTALNPVNTVVQSLQWFGGLIYVLGLLGCIGLSIGFRITGDKWLMAFFFGCMIILIIGSIFISNIYEDFYNDGSEVGIRLHEQGLLSWFILYSPMVMCLIGFICGIIMFTGDNENAYV